MNMKKIIKKARASCACNEALRVCEGLTWEGFLALKQAPHWAYWYAHEVIKGRWPEAEEVIAAEAEVAYFYARYAIKGRWAEAEAAIATDARWAYLYALD